MTEDDQNAPFEETEVGRTYKNKEYIGYRKYFIKVMIRMIRIAGDPTSPVHENIRKSVDWNLSHHGPWAEFWQTAVGLIGDGTTDEDANATLLSYMDQHREELAAESKADTIQFIQQNPEESEEYFNRLIEAREREQRRSKPGNN
jgi:hypothetical protein